MNETTMPTAELSAHATPPDTSRRERWDALLERWGDHVNPIVVKECRQALKSRQFFSCFLLTLAACWIWSLLGTWDASYGNSRYGLQILSGYYAILAFPLMVIVPFSAFRSLNLERDDKTYELLAVTTLPPSKIVIGKLVGALVQIALYVSATLPCFGFTALLRGVDLPTMFYGLSYLVLNSVCYACIGLMLGAVVKERFLQMPAMIVLLIASLYLFVMTIAATQFWIYRGNMTRLLGDQDFQSFNLGYLVANLSSCGLFLSVAMSQITFAGGNRSTWPRICAFVQHVLFLGWMTYSVWTLTAQGFGNLRMTEELLEITITIMGLYWYTIGVFLTGEPERLSSRVRRELPQSWAAQVLLGGFFPGPGRGLLFVSGNVFSVCAASAIVDRFVGGGRGLLIKGNLTLFALGAWGYLTIYLGLGCLILRLIGQRIVVNVLMRVLIHAVLFFGMLLISIVIIESSNSGYMDASFGTLINPFFTLGRVLNNSSHDASAIAAFIGGIVVLLFNLPGIVAEFRQDRVSMPERVLAEILAARKPVVAGPTNPWDQPDDDPLN